jgi:hypothetical protein
MSRKGNDQAILSFFDRKAREGAEGNEAAGGGSSIPLHYSEEFRVYVDDETGEYAFDPKTNIVFAKLGDDGNGNFGIMPLKDPIPKKFFTRKTASGKYPNSEEIFKIAKAINARRRMEAASTAEVVRGEKVEVFTPKQRKLFDDLKEQALKTPMKQTLYYYGEITAYSTDPPGFVFYPKSGACFAKIEGVKIVPFGKNFDFDTLGDECTPLLVESKKGKSRPLDAEEIRALISFLESGRRKKPRGKTLSQGIDLPKRRKGETQEERVRRAVGLSPLRPGESEESYLKRLIDLPVVTISEEPTMGVAPDPNDTLLKEILSMMTGKPKAEPLAPGVEVRTTSEEITSATLTSVDLPKIKSFPLRPYIEESQRQSIAALLKRSSKEEIELSFGKVVEREFAKGREIFFEPGVASATAFKNLLCDLELKVQFETLDRKERSKDVIEIATSSKEGKGKGDERESIRKITTVLKDGDVVEVWQRKVRSTDESVLNATWGYRMTASTETAIEPVKNFQPNIRRERTRTSYFSSHFRIDCSKVVQTRLDRSEGDNRGKSFTKYEVEIERTSKKATVAELNEVISYVIQGISGITSPNKEVIAKSTLSLLERQYATLSLETLVGAENIKTFYNKPTNIKYHDFLMTSGYAVTVKLNGVRRFILITRLGVYVFGPSPLDIWKVGPGSVTYDATLIDCEKYGNVYYAFDMLFYKGADIRTLLFASRLAKIDDALTGVIFFDPLMQIEKKEYFLPRSTDGKPDNVYDRVTRAKVRYDELIKNGTSLDGFIFQAPGKYSDPNKKWKPAGEMTIDFKVVLIPGSDNRYNIFVGADNSAKDLIFKGDRSFPHQGTLYIENGILQVTCENGSTSEDISADGTIVECKWDFDIGEFVPVRPRDDRDRPNNLSTARDVWRDIMRPVEMKDIQGDTLKIMRVWHNRWKMSLINQEIRAGQSIVDVGSGRFGDLQKWEDAEIKTVYVVEPNETNLKEGLRRAEERRKDVERMREEFRPKLPKIKVIRNEEKELVGIEDTSAIVDAVGSHPVNAVTSFFSLTFLAEDQEKMDKALDTIDNLLGPGGKFIGIVLDRKRVKALLEWRKDSRWSMDKETGFVTFTCDAFTIRQASKFSPDPVEGEARSLFGEAIDIKINDIDSMVKGDGVNEGFQREYLVDFEYIVDELKKRKIVMAQRSASDKNIDYTGFLAHGKPFDCLPEESKRFSALNRYFVFERKMVYKRREEKTSLLDPDVLVSFSISYLPNVELEISGAEPGSSSFIHSVLRAVDTTYSEFKEPSREDEDKRSAAAKREEYVVKLRKSMAKKLDFETYEKLEYGNISRSFEVRATKSLTKSAAAAASKKAIKEKGFEMYKALLADSREYVGKNLVSDLLSQRLKINIITLDASGYVIKPKGGECIRDVFNRKQNTVIVVTQDQTTYNTLVGEDGVTLFKPKSEIVKTILDHACPKK